MYQARVANLYIHPSEEWKVQPNLGENVAVNVAEQLTERQVVIYSTIKSNVAVNTKLLSNNYNLIVKQYSATYWY